MNESKQEESRSQKNTSSNTLVVFLFTENCLKVILPMKENVF